MNKHRDHIWRHYIQQNDTKKFIHQPGQTLKNLLIVILINVILSNATANTPSGEAKSEVCFNETFVYVFGAFWIIVACIDDIRA
jgi:hypothetical protein